MKGEGRQRAQEAGTPQAVGAAPGQLWTKRRVLWSRRRLHCHQRRPATALGTPGAGHSQQPGRMWASRLAFPAHRPSVLRPPPYCPSPLTAPPPPLPPLPLTCPSPTGTRVLLGPLLPPWKEEQSRTPPSSQEGGRQAVGAARSLSWGPSHPCGWWGGPCSGGGCGGGGEGAGLERRFCEWRRRPPAAGPAANGEGPAGRPPPSPGAWGSPPPARGRPSRGLPSAAGCGHDQCLMSRIPPRRRQAIGMGWGAPGAPGARPDVLQRGAESSPQQRAVRVPAAIKGSRRRAVTSDDTTRERPDDRTE